jgi:superfamily II DNA or RNA helicase
MAFLANPAVAKGCDFMVVDECHHFIADEWKRVWSHRPKRLLGLTATPERGDGKPLGNLFDELVVAIDYPEAFRDGWLTRPSVIRPPKCLAPDLAWDPVEAILEHAKGMRGFVFTRSVSEAECMAKRLPRCGYVHGKMPGAEREEIISKFRHRELDLLTNVHILTEGFDEPSAKLCALARGMSHQSTLLQAVGRVLRPFGDETPVILDLPGLTHIHGLVDEERVYSLKKGIELEKSIPVYDCPRCGAAQSSPLAQGCNTCEWVADPKVPRPPRIYNEALRAVYAGSETEDNYKRQELIRLLAIMRAKDYTYYWVSRQYKKLFGHSPKDLETISPREKRRELQRHRARATTLGYKSGWASFRYKEAFGRWPG